MENPETHTARPRFWSRLALVLCLLAVPVLLSVASSALASRPPAPEPATGAPVRLDGDPATAPVASPGAGPAGGAVPHTVASTTLPQGVRR